MNILITGATGFIGSHLVERLIKKNKITVLVRKTSKPIKLRSLSKLKVNIIYGDLTNQESLTNATKNIDVIYHCAAMLGSPEITYKQIYEANVTGTKNLVKAAEQNKVKRFIHISTVAVFGTLKHKADESTICKPASDYDKTKYLSELAVKKSSLKYTIIRPTMVYGPGEMTNKAKMFRFIQKGLFRIIGDGKNLMALVYIGNLVDGILKAANTKKAISQTYIISDEHSYTMNKFIYTITKSLGVKTPSHLPKCLAYLGAFCFKILSFVGIQQLLSINRINSLTRSSSFSIAKAKKELNYNPEVSLEDGVRKTTEWYREIGFLK
jgi:nucleoside-diphosphate-sugar epimerase